MGKVEEGRKTFEAEEKTEQENSRGIWKHTVSEAGVRERCGGRVGAWREGLFGPDCEPSDYELYPVNSMDI